ncbi:three-helix bundle dimerization domain-containing protein [Streptomyces sp. NPDC050759]|uniref:three-helix bundle dimerization domain-containing protein n=1 Tax=Streptomyces sp. NPDC050759 TaxID=3365635 RepID=UPI0037A3F1C7
MADKAREDEAIRGIVERLTDASRATRSPAEVQAAVAKAHASFADRPVREFIPVLVERQARTLLNQSSN